LQPDFRLQVTDEVNPELLQSPSSTMAIESLGHGQERVFKTIDAEEQDAVPPLTSTPSKAAVAADLAADKAAKGATLPIPPALL